MSGTPKGSSDSLAVGSLAVGSLAVGSLAVGSLGVGSLAVGSLAVGSLAVGSLAVGDRAEPWVIGPLTRTDIVRYQGASGDLNPIHHDEPFATAAGYPAPLVVGMYPAGVMGAWATGWLGAEHVRRIRVRWRQQMWPGDTLIVTGVVASIEDAAGGEGGEGRERRVELELGCTNQRGELCVQGWASFVVPWDTDGG